VQSFSDIQTGQIETLQKEISKMIEKLEDIKDNYESEIQEKDKKMSTTKEMAL